MWCGVVAGLMLINELTRSSKWFSYVVYILVPVILTFAVWPKTAGPESSVGTWFHWVKVYSALAGVLGFMYLRHSKKGISYKWLLIFPPLILSINIMEAVIRDFQVYSMYHGDLFGSVVNGVTMQGGSWNIMNGIAGIINIITIAYDLWNFAYVYNCVSDHSFYAGAALLVSCTIPAFFMGKGAWLQHRAQTLAIWMMFTMCFPVFVDESMFAVKSSHNPDALWTLSALALAFNIGVLVFHFYKIFKYKRNPLKVEVYIDEPKYAEIAVKK
jgi:hypothetical protein